MLIGLIGLHSCFEGTAGVDAQFSTGRIIPHRFFQVGCLLSKAGKVNLLLGGRDYAVKAARQRRSPNRLCFTDNMRSQFTALPGEDGAVGPGGALPVVGPSAVFKIEAGLVVGVMKGVVYF